MKDLLRPFSRCSEWVAPARSGGRWSRVLPRRDAAPVHVHVMGFLSLTLPDVLQQPADMVSIETLDILLSVLLFSLHWKESSGVYLLGSVQEYPCVMLTAAKPSEKLTTNQTRELLMAVGMCMPESRKLLFCERWIQKQQRIYFPKYPVTSLELSSSCLSH